jgi:hypothetical protein
MRIRALLPLMIVVLGVTIMLLEAPQGYTQQGKGKGNKGFGGGDPGKIFDDWLDRGKKGYVVISEMKMGKQELEAFAKKQGIADGKITRDQYIKFFDMREQIREELKASGALQAPQYPKGGNKGGGKAPPTGGGPTPPPTTGAPPKTDTPAPTTGPGGDDQGDRAERMFKGYDRNGDSFLNQEEIQTTKNLRNEWEKWDANKDSKVSLDEWRAYMKSREQAAQDRKDEKKTDTAAVRSSSSSGGIDIITIEEYGKMDNWRAGKLPELPDWFKECDLNKDGQVAMYEWNQKSKEPIAKFLAMDANSDGLLTPDEVVRHQRQASAATGTRTGTQTATAGPKEPKKERKGKK